MLRCTNCPSVRATLVLALWCLLTVTGLAGESAELVLQNGSQTEVAAVCWSPDGRLVASSGESATIRLWDSKSGGLARTLPGHAQRVFGLALRPDGSGECGVTVGELPSGRRLRTVVAPDRDEVYDLDLSADGHWLATAGQWVNRLWATDSGALKFEMRGHEDTTFRIRFSPDGRE